MLQAAFRAAEVERAPVIVQVSPRSIAYAGLRPLAALATALAEACRSRSSCTSTTAPVWRSVRPRSTRVYVGDVRRGRPPLRRECQPHTRRRRGSAHEARRRGRAGQVGHASHEHLPAELTDPEEAGRFVAETGVDALAVAIGTVHGMTETGAVLDVERIADLARHVDAALVMHGSSGVDDETLARAVEAGIRKVNLSTALQRVFMDTLRQSAAPLAMRRTPALSSAMRGTR